MNRNYNDLYERRELLTAKTPQEWLTTTDAANYLAISENALRICVHRGQIRSYKFGRRLRFRLDELRQHIVSGRR